MRVLEKRSLLCVAFLLGAQSAWFADGGQLTPGNVLVTHRNQLFEYTPAGVLVQVMNVPYPSGPRPAAEHVRDIAVDQAGNVHVYNGTFDPFLSTYTPSSNGWAHHTHVGWSTANNVSYGGVGTFQNFIYLTDMRTFGDGGADEVAGVVRFDRGDFSSQRFAEPVEFIDLTVGLDGLLYALNQDERTVYVYEPLSMQFQRTINLATWVRGIAVNGLGEIFAASWDGNIYHFDPNGAIRNSRGTGFFNLTDIDVSLAGELVVGSWFGAVVLTQESLSSLSSFTVGNWETFVAFTTPIFRPALPFFTVTSKHRRNKLEWLNPTTPAYVSTRILYRTDRFPKTPSDGTELGDFSGVAGAKDSFEHLDLENDTTYYYAAFVNLETSFSPARFTRGRPFDTSGPVKWAYSTGAAAMYPPGIGPAVYATSNDRALHSMVRGSDGGTWPANWVPLATNAPMQARPPVVPTSAVAGATRVVFLGSQDGHVYAVNAETGAQLWKSPRLGDMVQAAVAGMFTAFGGAYDYLFVGTRNSTSNNKFYALNVADGSVAGAPFDNGGSGGIGIISGGASVDYASNLVYFASRSRGSPNTLWCLRITAGGLDPTPVWTRILGDIDGSPVRRGDRTYVGTNSGVVYGFDAGNGSGPWSFGAGDGMVKGFIFPDRFSDDLYLSTGTKVWGLSDRSPQPNWPAVSTIPSPSTPLFTPGGTYLLVGGSDGRLYQLDVSMTPPTVTSVRLGNGSAAVGSPSLDVQNKMAYVGTDAGIIYAVELPIP